jgi:hypothetical protein
VKESGRRLDQLREHESVRVRDLEKRLVRAKESEKRLDQLALALLDALHGVLILAICDVCVPMAVVFVRESGQGGAENKVDAEHSKKCRIFKELNADYRRTSRVRIKCKICVKNGIEFSKEFNADSQRT